jgi:cobalt-precorrin-5B (C1)-methyltransferase
MSDKKQKKLKSGFTTGTAAAAAAKGALAFLIAKDVTPEAVTVRLLTGDNIRIPVHSLHRMDENSASCSVIKDAGDDPDITHKAEIGAIVRFEETPGPGQLVITGGEGVGTVTKPGLETSPGQPAITSGPRKMIAQSIKEVLDANHVQGNVTVEVFVPRGRILAKNTLNARLGILGGISILGTTGVVRPLSHDAYIATIDAALNVARAAGLREVVLTTGRRSERFSQTRWRHLPEEAFVQIGDFFEMSLKKVAAKEFAKAAITVFFGKAVKMAQGIPHTHAAKSRLTLKNLAKWALETTGDELLSQQIAAANTARHAFEFIHPDYPQLVERVGQNIVTAAQKFSGGHVNIRAVIYDFDGNVVFDSEHLESRNAEQRDTHNDG